MYNISKACTVQMFAKLEHWINMEEEHIADITRMMTARGCALLLRCGTVSDENNSKELSGPI